MATNDCHSESNCSKDESNDCSSKDDSHSSKDDLTPDWEQKTGGEMSTDRESHSKPFVKPICVVGLPHQISKDNETASF